jgi:hypothetical protein
MVCGAGRKGVGLRPHTHTCGEDTKGDANETRSNELASAARDQAARSVTAKRSPHVVWAARRDPVTGTPPARV